MRGKRFIDIKMPKRDGFSLIKEMFERKLSIDAFKVMTTGGVSDDMNQLEQHIEKGLVHDVLEKPFDENEIERILKKANETRKRAA